MQTVPYSKYKKYLGKIRRCLICQSDPKGNERNVWATDKYFRALECKKCGYISVEPSLTPEGLKIYYQNNMGRRIENIQKMKLRDGQYEIDKKFLEKYISKGNILDVGCGGGIFLSKLNKKFKKFGIDLDQSSINFAKKKFNYDFRLEQLGKDSFKKKTFDLIIFRGVIEHIYNPKVIIKRAIELLKPRGKLFFCATPNGNSFCANVFKEKWNLWHPIQHINIFTVKTLHKLCGKSKFNILAEDYPYLNTPYENLKEDYEEIRKFLISKKKRDVKSPAFWGNMLSLILEKN